MDITTFELNDATVMTLLDVWTTYVASRLGDLSEEKYREKVQSAREALAIRVNGSEEAENADEVLVSHAKRTFNDHFRENPEVATERAAAESESRAADRRAIRM
jgi:hypothetical protein